MGDTLLTFWALAALRAHLPGLRLHLVGSAAAAPLATLARSKAAVDTRLADGWTPFDAPEVTGLFSPAGPGRAACFAPVAAGVAWCADPEGLLTKNLSRLGATRTLIAPSRPASGKRLHVADHLVATLRPLGIEPPEGGSGFYFDLPDSARARACSLLNNLGLVGQPFVAVHPGSGSPGKNWPATWMAALVDRLPSALGVTPLLLAGPADHETIDSLIGQLHASPPPLLRDLPLDELAAVLSSARAYVGNDSGPTHLAAMLDLPTLALFGPSDPVQWAPRGRRVRIIRRQPLADLSPEVVMGALRELVS